MAIRELTCISCPLGCPLKVETDENGAVLQVTGNTCKRGEVYGKKEVTAPERTVTSTVAVVGGGAPLASVRGPRRTSPKGKIFDCMEAIRAAKIQAPVHIGDVVVENVCGTGVDGSWPPRLWRKSPPQARRSASAIAPPSPPSGRGGWRDRTARQAVLPPLAGAVCVTPQRKS